MTPGPGNRTRDTLVGGERSHHCAIPAPISELLFLPKTNMKSEGSGDISGFKLENRTHAQSRTPVVQSKVPYYLSLFPA